MALLADAVGLIVAALVLWTIVRSVILALIPMIGLGAMILLIKAFH